MNYWGKLIYIGMYGIAYLAYGFKGMFWFGIATFIPLLIAVSITLSIGKNKLDRFLESEPIKPLHEEWMITHK